jgi:hypothetical protein
MRKVLFVVGDFCEDYGACDIMIQVAWKILPSFDSFHTLSLAIRMVIAIHFSGTFLTDVSISTQECLLFFFLLSVGSWVF